MTLFRHDISRQRGHKRLTQPADLILYSPESIQACLLRDVHCSSFQTVNNVFNLNSKKLVVARHFTSGVGGSTVPLGASPRARASRALVSPD